MSDRSVYDCLKDHFEKIGDVEVASGKGAQGIKYDGKMFAMFSKGELPRHGRQAFGRRRMRHTTASLLGSLKGSPRV